MIKKNSPETLWRGFALALALCWFVGWAAFIPSSERLPLQVVAIVAWLLAYIGAPLVAARLSREIGDGNGCVWALFGLIAPGITLPIAALRKLRQPQLAEMSAFQAGSNPGTAAPSAFAPARDVSVQVAPQGAAKADPAVSVAVRTEGQPAGLTSPDRLVRAAAIHALGQTGDAGAVDSLRAALRDFDPFVRRMAAQALSQVRGERALTAVLGGLTDPAPEVRRQAALGAGRLGSMSTQAGQDAAPALFACLHDEDPGVRKIAAELLGGLGDPRALEPLIAQLGDPDAGVRAGAVLGLGDLGDGRATAALTRCLDDGDPAVSQYAAWVLPRLPRPSDGEPAAAERFEPVPVPASVPAPASACPPASLVPDAAQASAVAVQGAEPLLMPAGIPAAPPPRLAHMLEPDTNPLAIGSLAAGIATWLLLPLLGALVAVVTGHLALREIRRRPQEFKGQGMAIAGLVLGYGQFGAMILVLIAILIAGLLSSGRAGQVPSVPTPAMAGKGAMVAITATMDPGEEFTKEQNAYATAVEATAQAYQAEAMAQAVQAEATAQAYEAEAEATAQAYQAQLAAWAEEQRFAVDRALAWPLIVEDSFDSNANGWPTGIFESEYGTITQTLDSGTYSWQVRAVNGVHTSARLLSAEFTDVVFSADVSQPDPPGGAGCGLTFRVDGDNHYYFGLFGQYFALSVLEGGQWAPLIYPTFSPAIQSTGVNRMSVVAVGTHFTLLIDGEIVGEADDARIGQGSLGLAGDVPAGIMETFAFDDVEVRIPPGATPQSPRPTAAPILTFTP